jgi:chromosomal replication initiator protein
VFFGPFFASGQGGKLPFNTSPDGPKNGTIPDWQTDQFFGLLAPFSLDGTTVVNGVSLIPLSGTNFDSSFPADPAAQRLSAFVAGSENSLVDAALRPFLDRTPTHNNPLVLYGPHASGKSHLALGLADWWRRRYPDAPVQCLTGSDFARQYADALAAGRLELWRAELRGLELLVIDDLGELADKRTAQRELLSTLDALDETGALVVVTARSLPSHWPVLVPALRSRLSAGLLVPLAFPAPAARRVILERLAAARGVSLAAGALDALARKLPGSVPTLLAAIVELELAARADSQPVDPERVGQLVAPRSTDAKHSVREIACVTAKYFGLKLSDLKSPARRRSLVAARGVAMFLARHLTPSSLEQIGTFFGRRDHTTVLHACRRTEKLLRRDRATRLAVADVKKLLAQS